MYTPPMFKTDRAASLAFAEARGFGIICAWNGKRPIASSLPFYMTYADDGTPTALFHVARNNALIKAADGVTPWALAVVGENAYVTPDWYVSVDQVPTWLYQAVHLTGPVRTMSEDELVVQIDTLSAKFENRMLPKKPWTSGKMTSARLEALNRMLPKKPWTSGKMTSARLEALKKGIVGLSMRVEDVEGSFKLNQQKSEADYAAVANGLAAMPDHGSQTIAQRMRETRPQAFAATTNEAASLEGSM